MTFNATALFGLDKATLRPEAKRVLDGLVEKIKTIHLQIVIAIGYADSTGSNAYNQRLSERRAKVVRAYFISRGVSRELIYIEGKGEKDPAASNRTEKGREANRRVEIQVVGKKY